MARLREEKLKFKTLAAVFNYLLDLVITGRGVDLRVELRVEPGVDLRVVPSVVYRNVGDLVFRE